MILDPERLYEGRELGEGNTVDSKELMALTGATYRQIDYWCRQGYIQPVGDGTPGSGHRRRFNTTIIDKVKLITRISQAFERPNSPLKHIVDHYDEGVYDLGDGIHLTWDVIEIERES